MDEDSCEERFAALRLWQRLGILAVAAIAAGAVLFVTANGDGGLLLWWLFWLIVVVGFLALFVATAIGLFRIGKRRRSRGWWTLVIGLFLYMLLLPPFGVVSAVVVVLVERWHRRKQRADRSPPAL